MAPPHRRVACAGGLHALVIDRVVPEADAEGEALALAVTQAAILSAYAARDDVLPVALGAAFSDDRALAAHLAAIAPQVAVLRAALAEAAEYVVAIETVGATPLAPAVEAAGYLRRRQADRDARRNLDAARRAFAARVLAVLGASGAPVAAPRAPDRTSLLTVSALVRRRSAGEAAAALAALAPEAARLGLGLRMIGPCAPFSFVTGGAIHG
jgi:hypothetical protein